MRRERRKQKVTIGYMLAECSVVGDCLIWPTVDATGYGKIWVAGASRFAHRVSYAVTHGSIPAGAKVLHSCDVRACISPAHLRAGTHQENMRDMVTRGRSPINKGRSKLSAAQRQEIIAMADDNKALLAKRYGVDVSTVWRVINNRDGKNGKLA